MTRLRLVTVVIGLCCAVLPLAWRTSGVGILLGTLAMIAAFGSGRWRGGASTTLCACATIGEVAVLPSPPPELLVLLIAAVLAAYLLLAEIVETPVRAISRQLLAERGVELLAAIAGAAALLVLALLPAVPGMVAVVVVSVGAAAGGVLMLALVPHQDDRRQPGLRGQPVQDDSRP